MRAKGQVIDEDAFRQEFVKRVEKASKSKGKIFRTKKELAAHLKSISNS